MPFDVRGCWYLERCRRTPHCNRRRRGWDPETECESAFSTRQRLARFQRLHRAGADRQVGLHVDAWPNEVLRGEGAAQSPRVSTNRQEEHRGQPWNEVRARLPAADPQLVVSTRPCARQVEPSDARRRHEGLAGGEARRGLRRKSYSRGRHDVLPHLRQEVQGVVGQEIFQVFRSGRVEQQQYGAGDRKSRCPHSGRRACAPHRHRPDVRRTVQGHGAA
mmetsp:Transcript_42042/g.116087  ORF Transcript_42042/g.116087 Transcript_42042/m.116087 type:complete len:219 (+) Transcript_42042:1402-2058(+)